MTDELLAGFRALIYEKSDLHFSPVKQVFFERHLQEGLKAEGLSDYGLYLDLARRDSAALERLIQRLTTNMTYFFRDPGQFRALRERVFPEIIDAANRAVISSWSKPGWAAAGGGRSGPMRIRVWSSGCSTGEETYSIAFTLLDALKFPRAWDVAILGTDIKKEALETARKGYYEEQSMKEMDPSVAAKYMERRGAGWAVRDYPASIVQFAEVNLKDVSMQAGRNMVLRQGDGPAVLFDARDYFDVILCRNVMIYFDRDGQQRLVRALYDCLRPGGFLFTGDSESLHLFDHGLESINQDGALYYRKPTSPICETRCKPDWNS